MKDYNPLFLWASLNKYHNYTRYFTVYQLTNFTKFSNFNRFVSAVNYCKKNLIFISFLKSISYNLGMQLSWLERLTGSQEVVGSSPIFFTNVYSDLQEVIICSTCKLPKKCQIIYSAFSSIIKGVFPSVIITFELLEFDSCLNASIALIFMISLVSPSEIII